MPSDETSSLSRDVWILIDGRLAGKLQCRQSAELEQVLSKIWQLMDTVLSRHRA